MRPPTPIAELKIVGGALPLDFVNTVGSWAAGDFRDALVRVDDLIAWAERVSLVDHGEAKALRETAAAHPEAAQRLLREARTLRATLHAVFAGLARGEAPSEDAHRALASAAERAMTRRRLERHAGGFVWGWAEPNALGTVLDRIAYAAAELLVQPARKPLKECPSHACGWLFLDTSRNGKRRWCSEEDCGTPSRVRAFRDRQKR